MGNMEPLINKTGITIKQLKDFIKDLPDKDENGEDFEVWIGGNNCHFGLSNPCTEISKLNIGDLIFEM